MRRARLRLAMAMLLAGPVGPAGAQTLVGFAQDTLANDWRAAQVRQFVAAMAGEPGVEILVTNAQGHTAQQIMDIEDLVAKGVRVLVTSPRDGVALAPAIAAAHDKGVAVVLLTRRAATQSYTTFIGPDDEAIGRQAAQLLARRLNGSGRVLMLTGVPTASTAIARTKGFVEELANHPGMRITSARTGNYLRAGGLQATEEALAEQEFDAIFAQSDSMASGARLVLQGAGIAPGAKPTVGVDYIREARAAIRSGAQEASFTYPTCASEGADIVKRILKGQPVPREITVPSVMVTGENVDDVPTVF